MISLGLIEPAGQTLLLTLGCSFRKCLILHMDGVRARGMMAESRERTAVCHIVNRDGCRSRPSWNTWQAAGTEQAELLKIESFLLAPDPIKSQRRNYS